MITPSIKQIDKYTILIINVYYLYDSIMKMIAYDTGFRYMHRNNMKFLLNTDFRNLCASSYFEKYITTLDIKSISSENKILIDIRNDQNKTVGFEIFN